MRIAETVTFGGGGLDRAAHLRSDPPREGGVTLPLWRGKPLCEGGILRWVPCELVPVGGPDIFLGLADGVPRFARDLSSWVPDDIPQTLGGFSDPSEQHHPDLPGAFVELRSLMADLSPLEAELAATAKAILGWHETHGFCARCGAKSEIADAGWMRVCNACGARHFPRTDPVVIMLITNGNSVLLGRSSGWPEGMYSLLAGFVEPGEPIEAAVRREVFEEAGVKVGRASYLASQPWPFPASLMVGCWGEALTREITLDPAELDDALWLTREEMVDAFAGTHPRIWPARRGSIARFLIEAWLADRLE